MRREKALHTAVNNRFTYILHGSLYEDASSRVLKKALSCFDRLSTNGKSPTIAMPAPFALSLSKGERRGFQYPLKLIAVSIMAQPTGQREGIHLMQPIGTVEDQLGPHRIGAQQ